MRTSKIKVQAMTIPVLTSSNGERYWPMRPLCEAIELNWHSQAAKLHPPRYTPREHDVCLPGLPPMKQALCLSQAEFEFWLKGLNSRKVNRTARLRVDQLRAHFFGEASADMEHQSGPTDAAPKILRRILKWRLQQTVPSERADLSEQITGQFQTPEKEKPRLSGALQRCVLTSLPAPPSWRASMVSVLCVALPARFP